MRRAMILGALGLMFLLPVAEAAANQRQQDRATAQQPRAAAPQAQRTAAPAARQAAQPQRTALAERATPQQRQATRPTAAPQRTATTQAPAARQQAAAQRSGLFRSAAAAPAGMPRATGTCTRRDAQGRCVSTTPANTRWQGGLPPMTMAQQECPAGTVATLARGHANVVRCLPI